MLRLRIDAPFSKRKYTMKKQKGFTISYVIVLIAVLALAAGAAALRHSLIKQGYNDCESAYKTRDNTALKDALAKLDRLQKELVKREAEAQAEVSKLGTQLKEQVNENTQLAARNRLLTGTRSVRSSAFVASNCDSGPKSEASSGAPRSNGTAACDLSTGAKQSLRTIGLRADKTALQLSACQQLLLLDRKTCNSPDF